MKLINFISPGKLKLFLAECKKIFAPISHIHKTSDIENLDENLNNKYDKTAVQTQGTVLAAPSDKDGIADFRKLTKEDIGLGDVAQIVHLTKAEYKELEKKGQLNPDIDYATTDESDNITDSSVQLWNTSSSLAQQGKYLSYSNQNGGKYLSLMNSSDNTAVAHAKLMDGESGEGMDVDADKVKTIDSKGILVDALGETTAQALIDEVAKRVIDLTGRMSTTENGLQSANDAITSLNSELWPRNRGTIIQNGTDMHTIKTPGYYCCTSNATAVTLKNCPFTEAFTLVVYWSTGYPGAYLSQEYTHYIGNRRVIQNYNADTATWKKYEFQITMK